MKEVQCIKCGAIFKIDGLMPEIRCSCRSREFIELQDYENMEMNKSGDEEEEILTH